MSGLEIAGVALGVIPLVIKGYSSIEMFFESYTGFENNMRRQRKIYLIQRNQFRRSIRTLLLGFINGSVIDEMIQDADHAEWESNECREVVSTIFSKDIGTSEEYKATVELIQSTLTNIREQYSFQQTPASQASNQSQKGWNKVTNAMSDGKQRLQWALSKKRKIDDLLCELSRYNHDLGRLVNEIRGNSKQAPAKFTPRKTFENIAKAQLAYTELYRAITSACSTCDHHTHAVDLALEDEGSNSLPQKLHFVPLEHKVMFQNGKESKVWCMRLKHLSQVQKPSPHVEPTQLPTLESTAYPTAPSITQSSAATEANPEATSGFYFQSNSILQGPQPLTIPPTQSLCLCLAAAAYPHARELERKQHQLGYLSDSGQPAYEVHLAGIEPQPSDVYYSLHQVLAQNATPSDTIERLLRPYQRWKLAYILSCSLLRLYSTPWLRERERWASQNVKFFLHRGLANEAGIITTHLAIGNETGLRNDPSIAESVKNYQIYALGVLLLEIALGTPLNTSAFATSRSIENIDTELQEYLTAMKLDKHRVAAQLLGPQYGEIVTRCLSFKFNTTIHDLGDVALQREFYSDVIFQLQECLRIMTEPI